MEVSALTRAFNLHVWPKGGRGLDRLTVEAFRAQLANQLQTINRKVHDGSYRFTPYLQKLVLKGKDDKPREIALPCIRDRVVLHQLKDYLHSELPEAVERSIPNEYVRRLVKFADSQRDFSRLAFIRADIRRFYDRVQHKPLLAKLEQRGLAPEALLLIKRALRTPTLADGSSRSANRKARNRVGIPQGLAISNVLASLYIRQVHDFLVQEFVVFERYVDDLLIIVESSEMESAEGLLKAKLAELGLELNERKTFKGLLTDPFHFLGCLFQLPRVSVVEANRDKLLRSICAMLAEYRHRLAKMDRPEWMTQDVLQIALVEDLNERITGAIFGLRRYGWVSFYSQINDVQLLYRLDGIIRSLVAAAPGFGSAPSSLKSLVRAFFESRHTPQSGYIYNYDDVSTLRGKAEYLVRRAVISAEDSDTRPASSIDELFAYHRQTRLYRLERDVGTLY
jgi:RNA-directed DNA polymerase